MATSGDLAVAGAIGREFPDQDFSPVDRTSSAVMKRLGLTRVISFDLGFSLKLTVRLSRWARLGG